MTFSLPELPYAHDALGPHMSKETLEFHHDKASPRLCQQRQQPAQGHGMGRQVACRDRQKARSAKNPGLF